MTKQEFEERLGKAVNDRDYAKIEDVYTTHPSISETEGKDQIAYLYKTFGMRIIEDMEEVAYNLMHELYPIPDYLENYIDYSGFARDLSYDGYHETTKGVIEIR